MPSADVGDLSPGARRRGPQVVGEIAERLVVLGGAVGRDDQHVDVAVVVPVARLRAVGRWRPCRTSAWLSARDRPWPSTPPISPRRGFLRLPFANSSGRARAIRLPASVRRRGRSFGRRVQQAVAPCLEPAERFRRIRGVRADTTPRRCAGFSSGARSVLFNLSDQRSRPRGRWRRRQPDSGLRDACDVSGHAVAVVEHVDRPERRGRLGKVLLSC